jgi:hypothetical protein
VTWRLSDQEFEALLETEPSKRYRYFLNHVVDQGYAWTLSDENDSPVTGEIEGRRILPLWPHRR